MLVIIVVNVSSWTAGSSGGGPCSGSVKVKSSAVSPIYIADEVELRYT